MYTRSSLFLFPLLIGRLNAGKQQTPARRGSCCPSIRRTGSVRRWTRPGTGTGADQPLSSATQPRGAARRWSSCWPDPEEKEDERLFHIRRHQSQQIEKIIENKIINCLLTVKENNRFDNCHLKSQLRLLGQTLYQRSNFREPLHYTIIDNLYSTLWVLLY